MTATSWVAAFGAVSVWAGATRHPLLLGVWLAFAWFTRWRLTAVGRWLVIGCVAAGAMAGMVADRPPDPLPDGLVTVHGEVRLELAADWGWRGIVATPDGQVLVRSERRPQVSWVEVEGKSDGTARRVAGRWIAGTVDAEQIVDRMPPGPHRRTAEGLRIRITEQVEPGTSNARALLLGFLVGDTTDVTAITQEEMRRAGLSHLVAVSGSNVALFLFGLMIVFAPMAIHPGARLILIVNGLLVFGGLTRWEPSVIRASAMAGLVAVGRFAGIPLDPVTALAAVAGGAILMDPTLAGSVGFQLSVAASAGLLYGARSEAARHPVARALTATISAQVAVAPILLWVFGSIPLLSPLANLVAIPIVSVATVTGGVGAIFGVEPLVALAAGLADVVILVARVAAPWPQLGWIASLAVGGGMYAVWRFPRIRWLAALLASVVGAWTVLASPSAPDRGLLFLDVGQGDAIVVEMSGFTVLVDGGPDPARLAAAMDRYSIAALDLVVVSHVHADHVEGLTGLFDRVPIGEIWAGFEPHSTPSSQRLLEAAERYGVPIKTPRVGDRVIVGSDLIEVVGPRRRYAGPNDQSIVLVVDVGDVRTLLAGDIELAAQAELAIEGVDVLKVPHQGAGTSSPEWLQRHAGTVAVVSVGPNDFGHPAGWVIDELIGAGSAVFRTDQHGDVVLDLDNVEKGLIVRSGR